MSAWNDNIIAEFRQNDGKVGGPFEGAHLLLLTTLGAKSGKQRVSPMMYFPDGDRLIVVASKGGAPENPAWYHNLVANPEVHVEQSTESGIVAYDATASVLPRDERDVLFARIAARAPGFGTYQGKTDRIIPLVALTRKN
ncbi:MAG: AclJ-like protein [Glaciihabitans sp.]|jgi:deazaflavin-dependent oxidoreductase (nitroreductase family)|nr:AclJ-like protein [Glaciihabitans sp.]